MKNSILLAIIMVLGVACNGGGNVESGSKSWETAACDQAKNEVVEILTGQSKSCYTAMSKEDAEVKLAKRWESNDKTTVVSIKNDAFYTIQMIGTKILAFRGSIDLSDHSETNKVNAVTMLFEDMISSGVIEFGQNANGDETLTATSQGETTEYVESSFETELEINDEDIVIIRTQDDLNEFIATL